MKTKTLLITMILSILFLSCRTIEKATSSHTTGTEDTRISSHEQKEENSELSSTLQAKTESSLQKTERENSYYIRFFPPDSTGKQPVQEVGGSNKEAFTDFTSRTEWELSVKSQLDYLFTKTDQLEQQIVEKTTITEKTVSKTGFTFLEKIGLAAIGLFVLIVVFIVVKWRLSIR
jgi:cell division protein FtsL